MTKTNKLKTGIFALALMLLYQSNGWSQTPNQSVNPALVESSALPDAGQLRKDIADLKSKLQDGINQNRLSQNEIGGYNARIAAKEEQLKSLQENRSGTVNQKEESVVNKQQNATPGNVDMQPQLKRSSALAAQQELDNFKPKSRSAEINTLNREILQKNAERETGLQNSSLNKEQLAKMDAEIASLKEKIQPYLEREQAMFDRNNKIRQAESQNTETALAGNGKSGNKAFISRAEYNSRQQSTTAVSKYGIPVPPMSTVPEIKNYIRTVLQIVVPPNFSCPEYITKAGSVEKASAEIGKHYPQFYNKEGPEFIEAIRQYPLIYQDMMVETKAMRQYYPLKSSTSESQQH